MGRTQTNNYVKALDLKQEADELASQMVTTNDDGYDLDRSPNGVAMNYRKLYMGRNLGQGKVTGVASFEGSKDSPESLQLQADIVPESDHDRTLSRQQDGERIHYSRQFRGNESVVEHLVHDTATGTINYFLRDDKGQFLKS